MAFDLIGTLRRGFQRGKTGAGTSAYNKLPPIAPRRAQGIGNNTPINFTAGLPGLPTHQAAQQRRAAQTQARLPVSALKPTPTTTALSGTPTSTPAPASTYGPSSSQFSAADFGQTGTTTPTASAIPNYDWYSQLTSEDSATPTVASPTDYASQFTDIINQLRGKVSQYSTLSPEEQAAQNALTDFQGASASSIAGLEGQGRGIVAGLVQGQQAKEQQQDALKEQTLLGRLTAESAKRQNALTAAQNDLGYATEEQSRADQLAQYQQQRADQAAQLSQGNEMDLLKSGYQPITGGLAQVKQLGLTPDQVTKVNGKLYITPVSEDKHPALVQEYNFARDNGYAGSFLDYQREKNAATSSDASGFTLSPGATRYDAYGNPVATAGNGLSMLNATQQTAVADYNSTLDAISTAQAAIDAGGFLAGPISSFTQGFGGTIGTGQNQTRVAVDAALATIKANYQKALSGAGVSDNEVKRLSKALPSLHDTKATVKTKLKQLAAQIARQKQSLLSATGGSEQGNGQTGGYTNEELQYLQQNGVDISNFTNAPSTALNGSVDTKKLAAAIKQHESGGNYNARGGSGEGGAYQFMPSTWKSWASQYLGNANAPMTPANQDKVAEAKIADLARQGYNAQQIALIWNGGSPTIKAGTNKYGQKYDTGKYARSVLSLYGNSG